MNTTLAALLAQKDALELQIAELRAIERSKAITEARMLIDRHALRKDDLFDVFKPVRRKTAAQTNAKYRDPDSGETWDGAGIPPVWMRGRDKKDFRI